MANHVVINDETCSIVDDGMNFVVKCQTKNALIYVISSWLDGQKHGEYEKHKGDSVIKKHYRCGQCIRRKYYWHGKLHGRVFAQNVWNEVHIAHYWRRKLGALRICDVLQWCIGWPIQARNYMRVHVSSTYNQRATT